jgi:hypothetical protein
MSVIWHTSQAIAEFFIMCTSFNSLSIVRLTILFFCIVFLSRVLLSSRSGMQGSDQVVNQLVRNAISIGLFAMLWAVAGLATYFLLPGNTVYIVFDATSGSIYTHVCFGCLSSKSVTGKTFID